MSGGALAGRERGAAVGEIRGSKAQRVDRSRPPWRSWRTKSRAARAIRFVEAYCRIPAGVGAGDLIKLHPFQRELLEEMLADGVRTGGVQIPRGNAKSTLWAAVGLWAVCDAPDAPQVPLVAFNALQAQRTLMRPIRSMVRSHPELESRLAVYQASGDRRVWSSWNDGELFALPADEERLQGLNPTVALIDEAQTLAPAVVAAVLQGAGKRAESLVLSIGTPRPGGKGSALFDLRERGQAGAPLRWVEYAAPAGCAIDDRAAWRAANPALAAGMLHEDVIAGETTLLPEIEFRCYRLGQWVDAVVASWLPSGAWEACPRQGPPPAGSEVVLALAATWHSGVALVGATGDGAVFVAWVSDSASDEQIERVLSVAAGRWRVAELVVAPRCRPQLVARLNVSDLPIELWSNRADLEVTSATEWRRAIVEGRMAHDHDPTLAAHVQASVARSTPDGSLRLAAPDESTPVDAARAARMAWWRAVDLGARIEEPAIW